jgi:hypothetical protein
MARAATTSRGERSSASGFKRRLEAGGADCLGARWSRWGGVSAFRRSVSPTRAPNPACTSPRSGLSTGIPVFIGRSVLPGAQAPGSARVGQADLPAGDVDHDSPLASHWLPHRMREARARAGFRRLEAERQASARQGSPEIRRPCSLRECPAKRVLVALAGRGELDAGDRPGRSCSGVIAPHGRCSSSAGRSGIGPDVAWRGGISNIPNSAGSRSARGKAR